MPFRGLTISSLLPNPQEVDEMWAQVQWPTMKSWRAVTDANRFGQFLWQVKPPGQWAALLRYDEWLVASTDRVPLDVEYDKVFAMLKSHRSTLLCRLDTEAGLIGLAVRAPGGVFTPLMPGYFARTTIDVRSLDAEGVEHLSEQGHDWPEGLEKPAIIGLNSAQSAQHPVHREEWLKQYPEGLWLVTAQSAQGMTIYEVLS